MSAEPHHHGHAANTHRLTLALLLTLGYAGVEAAAGWWSGSLALLADAGHMLTDATSLGLAALAAWWSTQAPSRRFSYGMARLEILAGLLNAVLMLGVIGATSVAAVNRLLQPILVQGETITTVATVGLGINILVLWLLAHGEKNLNTRAALLHVLGDLLGSIAALMAGVIIVYTGWMPIDPILSLLIVMLIMVSTLSPLREALVALLEGVPPHLDLAVVGRAMAGVEGVSSVHDLHIWSLSSDRLALSAHVVVVSSFEHWPTVLKREQTLLAEQFDIHHITLQPESCDIPLQQITKKG
jgi:cobalt-zinc-cadmium efflux system protein